MNLKDKYKVSKRIKLMEAKEKMVVARGCGEEVRGRC